jgi:hypothetical protein
MGYRNQLKTPHQQKIKRNEEHSLRFDVLSGQGLLINQQDSRRQE